MVTKINFMGDGDARSMSDVGEVRTVNWEGQPAFLGPNAPVTGDRCERPVQWEGQPTVLGPNTPTVR